LHELQRQEPGWGDQVQEMREDLQDPQKAQEESSKSIGLNTLMAA
jgi:hypothetical protein